MIHYIKYSNVRVFFSESFRYSKNLLEVCDVFTSHTTMLNPKYTSHL